MTTTATPISREVAAGRARPADHAGNNIGQTERVLSVMGGGLLTLLGLRRRGPGSVGMAALGGGLLYRGLSGRCPLYASLGIDTAHHPHGPAASVAAGEGMKVVKAITIDRPADELYALWRDFENLPKFMHHLVAVKVDGNRSRWIARAPAGFTAVWDAEIINEEPGRLIAWRSLEGSRVNSAGSVHFNPAPGGRGTEVIVTLKYDPPGGRLTGWLAWAFGNEPGQQIQEDLRCFKQLVEAGEIATVQGQTTCRG
jgi:uncharacterized membrane protein